MQFPKYKIELEHLAEGYDFIVGCDEVGVGPVAGPVVAAACIIDPVAVSGYRSKKKWFYRVRDSKTTYEHERSELLRQIEEHCLCCAVGEVAPETIDRINIHNATNLAMKFAVENLLERLHVKSNEQKKVFVLLDGRFTIKELQVKPGVEVTQQAIVDGDASVLSIAAASIIAKVHRDKLLEEMDSEFPAYAFGKNKGYNTKVHREAILRNGITVHHRKSFLSKLLGAQEK
jgi:ribonuclease HII